MSSSAFSLTAMIPAGGFEVIRGKPVIGGLHDPRLQHHFCAYCMSGVFTRVSGVDDFVNLRATLLDDASWFVPFIETCTKDKLPWATLPVRHSYEGFPPPADYAGLMAEYAAQQNRA
jgi:hypothetical protein